MNQIKQDTRTYHIRHEILFDNRVRWTNHGVNSILQVHSTEMMAIGLLNRAMSSNFYGLFSFLAFLGLVAAFSGVVRSTNSFIWASLVFTAFWSSEAQESKSRSKEQSRAWRSDRGTAAVSQCLPEASACTVLHTCASDHRCSWMPKGICNFYLSISLFSVLTISPMLNQANQPTVEVFEANNFERVES